MEMNHLTVDDKRSLAHAYMNGNCTAEQEQTWETLILEDTEAMDIHIQFLSSMELEMPELSDSVQFTDRIMNKLPTHLYEKEVSYKEHRRRWYEHPIFHYTVAACLTLLFVSTGLFDKLMPGELKVIAKEQNIPISDQMMDMTVTWLDQLKR